MRKFIVAISAAAGLLLAGASAAQASVHHGRPNVTPACGDNCFAVSSLLLGTGTVQNAWIYGDTGVGGHVGNLVNLKFESNSHPNEDFTDYAIENGTLESVADFCDAWPAPQSFSPTSYVCQHYASFPVFEASWSPYGNESGLCVGVARANANNQNVTLRDCGASDNTLWIADLANSSGLYTPWINGGDLHFSQPLVLTVNAGSSHPDNQLKLERERLLTGGTPRDNQMFTEKFGAAP
jgi:hypothetical protein